MPFQQASVVERNEPHRLPVACRLQSVRYPWVKGSEHRDAYQDSVPSTFFQSDLGKLASCRDVGKVRRSGHDNDYPFLSAVYFNVLSLEECTVSE